MRLERRLAAIIITAVQSTAGRDSAPVVYAADGPDPSAATDRAVPRLLDPDPETAEAAFAVLSGSVISGSRVIAPGMIGDLISALDSATGTACARILLLLGMLCEPASPDADPQTGEHLPAVFKGLDRYLSLVPRANEHQALRRALLYLLAHFPLAADRILDAVSSIAEPEAVGRLRRCLTSPDYAAPETVDHAGRCWPSPVTLAFTADELASTAAARRALPREAVELSWVADTRALIAYAGGYAAATLATERR